jgi:hypothetical protein
MRSYVSKHPPFYAVGGTACACTPPPLPPYSHLAAGRVVAGFVYTAVPMQNLYLLVTD